VSGFFVSDFFDFAKAVEKIRTLIGHKVRFLKKSDTRIELDFVSDLIKKSVQNGVSSGSDFALQN